MIKFSKNLSNKEEEALEASQVRKELIKAGIGLNSKKEYIRYRDREGRVQYEAADDNEFGFFRNNSTPEAHLYAQKNSVVPCKI